MPEIKDVLDAGRFREIQARACLAANYWLSINLAAQRGDGEAVKSLWAAVRAVSLDASELVKALGTERADA